MRGHPQAALEAGAGDFECVLPAHRVVVVELAADQSRRQGDRLEVEAIFELCRTVNRHPEGATAELEVVQVEVKVGDDGSDQPLDLLQRVGVAHLVPSLLSLGLVLTLRQDGIGPISKEGVDPEEPTPSVLGTSKDSSSISAGG